LTAGGGAQYRHRVMRGARSTTTGAAAGRLRLWSDNPGKRAAERYYLLYTPIWGAVSGLVMVTGVAERMTDLQFMLYGVGLWLGVLVPPFVLRARADRGAPLRDLYHAKFQAWMLVFAFLGNYWTEYFYEILHMHYGFPTTWNLNHVPLFLYFVTVAYFTTYGTLLNLGRRALRARLATRPPWVERLAVVPLCLAVAGLETALNANPFMERLFCYDDLGFVLWFGTIMYGAWFVIALPFWFPIDEEPATRTPWREVLVGVLAAFMLVLVVNEVFKHAIAPHFTTVREGAIGLRDFGSSCLVPPRP
jgi:cycloeucalenol cycloisomerase